MTSAEDARAAALARLDAILARDLGAIDARFARAGLYVAAGRLDEAQADYLALLAHAPAHEGALNNLGTLLIQMGHRGAARVAYERVVALYTNRPTGLVNLGNLLLGDGDPAGALGHYEAALQADPDAAEAHQGLAKALIELGQSARAEPYLARGYQGRTLSVVPFRGTGEPVRVLQLVSARGGNIQTRLLLDDRRYEVTSLVAEFHEAGLPPHDLVVNAIGDADLCEAGLAAASRLLAGTTRPIVNRPELVMRTGRLANARRLAGLPGVVVPRTELIECAALLGPDGLAVLREHGFELPVLLRAPGYHTGQHFVQVTEPSALSEAAASLPGEYALTLEYLDATGADRLARKYRVAVIDGQLYPLHLAISDHWKVHYFTAGMADQPVRLAEEAAFLDDMNGVLGPKALIALASIAQELGLDYAGIDFGLNAAGQVLLFEANANMVVLPPGPDPRWDPRRRAAERVFAAIDAMLRRLSGQSGT